MEAINTAYIIAWSKLTPERLGQTIIMDCCKLTGKIDINNNNKNNNKVKQSLLKITKSLYIKWNG